MTVGYFERRSAGERLEQVSRPRDNAWVHIDGSHIDVDELSQQYGLDSSVVRDATDIRELPRTEFANDTTYVFVRIPLGAADAAETAPLLIAVSSQRLVTISTHARFSPLQVDQFITTPTSQPVSVLSPIIASVTLDFEQRIHALSAKIVSARKRLNRHEVENADFVEFVAIEDSLNEYRSSLEGMLSVVHQLADNRHDIFKSRDIEAFDDISLHIQQLLVAIDSNNQTVTSIQNAYSTIANNTLNQRMKLLTAITILLAIPNVFYGMYGMNIHLPFQNEWWAYPAIASFTVLLILLVYALAKRFRLF